MNKTKFNLYNPSASFREKDKDNITAVLANYAHNDITVSILSMHDNYFEVASNGQFSRSVTGHISRYLSRKCSLDHLYGQEGKKRRLFITKKIK